MQVIGRYLGTAYHETKDHKKKSATCEAVPSAEQRRVSPLASPTRRTQPMFDKLGRATP